MKLNSVLFASLVIIISFTACTKDNPTIPNEEELITTLKYTLTPVVSGSTVTLIFTDLDGDGGNPPTITVSDTIEGGIYYNGSLELLNETTSPTEDITAEVIEEADEHQVFYQSSQNRFTVSYKDSSGGFPIGIQTGLVGALFGNDTLTITLRHMPEKAALGVSDGEIINAGGETDIEVSFPVYVR